MGTSIIVAALVAANGVGALLPSSEVKKQNEIFQRYWGEDLVWKFEELPAKAVVPGYRVPYAGYIYPDRAGGTSSALRKYDAAFNRGMPATSHEGWDTTAFKEKLNERGFLGFPIRRMGTPHWYGHCNGWAAAAIRHAEPQETVYRNGVAFTPANIKALLAEIYIYNDVEDIAGPERMVSPAVLHAVMANWIGRGGHSIAMESDPGEEKWNYPIYGYASAAAKRSTNQVEVKMNIAYEKDTNGEYQEAPENRRIKYFHYTLNLDSQGNIIGGQYYRDSAIIDMLWVPKRPKLSRQPGNERGNPYVDVNQVLSIWRDSVPKEEREKWLVIDPHPSDRVLNIAQTDKLIPIQDPNAPRTQPPATPETEIAETTTSTPEASPLETAPSETTTTTELTTPETTSADASSSDATPSDTATAETTTPTELTPPETTSADASSSDSAPSDTATAETNTDDLILPEPTIADATDSDDTDSETDDSQASNLEEDSMDAEDTESERVGYNTRRGRRRARR